jgi:hypothetical protein
MNITRLLAGTALAVSMGAGAQAATLNASFSAALFSTTSTAQPIATGTTFGNALTLASGNGTGDMAGVVNVADVISFPSFTASVGQAVSFSNASWGSFAGTIQVASQTGPSSNRTVQVYAVGTFTGAGALAGFDPSPSSLTFSATQTGGANESISASFTFSSPPAPPIGAPEPMSLALFGLGLAGLGAAMRRKA